MVWSLPVAIGAFVGAALFTVVGGTRLSRAGDILADRTGLGEALFGGLFFGAVISASGIVMSCAAAIQGHPSMAYSNAVGGIAAQTAALVAVDMIYRRANLEHAAASLPNIMFCVVLTVMLVFSVALGHLPQWTLWAIHPGSIALVVIYVVGFRVARGVHRAPQWHPKQTRETVEDEPDDEASERSNRSLWVEFALVGLLVAGGGWVVATAAGSFVVHGGLDESFVGAALMGIVNALPELITAIAAIKRGALTLAVAGVLGGNTFDVLNLSFTDIAYREGSIYGATDNDDVLLTLTAAMMVAVLMGGMVGREKRGPATIGVESLLVLLLWIGALVLLALPGVG
jgi:cation:H+ antiporter